MPLMILIFGAKIWGQPNDWAGHVSQGPFWGQASSLLCQLLADSQHFECQEQHAHDLHGMGTKCFYGSFILLLVVHFCVIASDFRSVTVSHPVCTSSLQIMTTKALQVCLDKL